MYESISNRIEKYFGKQIIKHENIEKWLKENGYNIFTIHAGRNDFLQDCGFEISLWRDKNSFECFYIDANRYGTVE